MDNATKDALGQYSRGERASRSVREQTGLNFSQMLDAMGELGLRLPRFDYERASEDVRRGHDNLVTYLLAHKE